ncbi:MAG: hypothetical protein U5K37_01855 [Natrialbaceae archaeon]|nr:hypothetical protein [Natrialbaceae archaeon]
MIADILPLDEEVQAVQREGQQREASGDLAAQFRCGDREVDDRQREGDDQTRDGDHVELGLLVDDRPTGGEVLLCNDPREGRDQPGC